ncbi:hypothetical protein GSI_10539 [Ganoderma sinense ZZ0214-1]|uniref:Uncharacterized protein n=1 Tax=Ganoderma sinense ZZ0214-1 TaxID=1077348 RepID=A0A2G8S0V2_9APHY|nr:hypothetical protein GSI_10539 [Ganoderma sinense ZZ0214-1]
MSHAVLPQNLPQRARVRRETSHLHQLRLYPLYLLNLVHSTERMYQKCNTLCRRNLLRLTGQARKNRDGLRESGKYQFAKAMSMRSAERDPPVPIPPSMRTHREPTPVISSSSSDDEEEEDMGSDPIPAFVLPQPESPAPSPDRSDPDDDDDDDDDEEEESEEESSGQSSDEVEGVLRAARTDVAQLCREGELVSSNS